MLSLDDSRTSTRTKYFYYIFYVPIFSSLDFSAKKSIIKNIIKKEDSHTFEYGYSNDNFPLRRSKSESKPYNGRILLF